MSKFSIKRADNGVWYGTFAQFDQLQLKHGISTRLGGKSATPYAELNLGKKNADDPEIVKSNRILFSQGVGVPAAAVVTAQQVHGTDIHIVTCGEVGQRTASDDMVIADTDALVTAETGIPLMLFFADCVPVLLFDPIRRVVAVSHAGWKGTVGKIAQKTILAMQDHFGTQPKDCMAAIGPSIGPCCYEVDQLVIKALQADFPWWEKVVVPRGDRWMLDLWQANCLQLEEIGLDPGKIAISGICTQCNSALFYSHRADQGITGRMGAVIMLG